MAQTDKMRVTVHNGRQGQNGVYSAKHNDRNFDLSHAEHIDQSKTKDNVYYNIIGDKSCTFEQAEKEFYELSFSAHLEAKNQRYMKQRHPERCKTMDEFRTMPRYCPSECILQVGKLDNTIPASELQIICDKFIQWHQSTYPNAVILNAALHQDEQGAPHMHVRCAWFAFDNDGHPEPNQTKALAIMHIERPDPTKPKTKYNSPIMTYTKEIRSKFIEICRSQSLQIEDHPQHASQTGLSHQDYKARQAERQAKAADASRRAILQQTDRLQDACNSTIISLYEKSKKLPDKQHFDILKPAKTIPQREEKRILGRISQEAEPMYYCFTQEQIDNIQQALTEINNLRTEYQYYQSVAHELAQKIEAATAVSVKTHDQAITQAVDDALEPIRTDVRRLQNKVNSLANENAQLQSSSEWNKRIVEHMHSNTYHNTIKILKMEDAYHNLDVNPMTGRAFVYWGKDSKSNETMDLYEFLKLYQATCENAGIKPNNYMIEHIDKLYRRRKEQQKEHSFER